MQYSSTVQYSTAQYSTAQHSTVQYSTVQYSTAQHSTVQYSTAQYSTVQFSTVLPCSTVQFFFLPFPGCRLNSLPGAWLERLMARVRARGRRWTTSSAAARGIPAAFLALLLGANGGPQDPPPLCARACRLAAPAMQNQNQNPHSTHNPQIRVSALALAHTACDAESEPVAAAGVRGKEEGRRRGRRKLREMGRRKEWVGLGLSPWCMGSTGGGGRGKGEGGGERGEGEGKGEGGRGEEGRGEAEGGGGEGRAGFVPVVHAFNILRAAFHRHQYCH